MSILRLGGHSGLSGSGVMRLGAGVGLEIGGSGDSQLRLLTDFTALPDGVLPDDWTGATWSVASGRAINSPTLSGEILTQDPGLEIWTTPSNLTNYSESVAGTSTINQESTLFHGGSYSARMDVDASDSLCRLQKTFTSVAKNKFLIAGYWGRSSAAGKGMCTSVLTGAPVHMPGDAAWVNYIDSHFLSDAATVCSWYATQAASASIYWDDLSLKSLDLDDAIAYRQITWQRPCVRVKGSVSSGHIFGVMINVDNPANPQNYIMALCNGSKVFACKCIGGTITSLVNGAFVGYVANAPLDIVWIDPTTVEIYYNGLIVGTTQTVSDTLTGQYVALVSPNAGQISEALIYSAYGGGFLTVGDSVTTGAGDEVNGKGYRLMLSEVAGETMWVQRPLSHSSGGWTVAAAKAAIDAYLAGQSKAPQKVLFYLGANDVTAMPVEATYKANVAYMIDAIHTKWSAAHIYLGCGWRDGQESNCRILEGWNATVIAGRDYCSIGVSGTDVCDGHEAEYLPDGEDVHINHAGYVALTAAWAANAGIG